MARRNRNPISKYRRIATYQASIESVAIEARLQARLGPEVWEQIEAEWQERNLLDSYLPQQRQRFLEAAAARHNVSLAGIGA